MKTFQSVFVKRLSSYMKLRRGLGFQFKKEEYLLKAFDAYVKQLGYRGPLTQELALNFAACYPASSINHCVRRYRVVCCFSEYLATFEPQTPTLDPKALRPSRTRPRVHIFSNEEIALLLDKALNASPKLGLRGITLHAMVGLAASPETISTYRDALRLFLIFASQRKRKPVNRLSIEELDRDVVLAFLDHLEQERGNTIRTRNARLTAIRSFFQHVAYSEPAAMGIAQRVLTIPGKRGMKTVVGYLWQDELDAILKAPDCSKPQGQRDYALLQFLAGTGARVSEAIGVNVSDLRLEKPCQVVLRGKGAKDRIVPISTDMATLLQDLCTQRGPGFNSETAVFVNMRGKRLTRYGVNHILRRAVDKAATLRPSVAKKNISPHTLRHTTAMNLLKSNVDLTTIQSWLGHASINTTHQYVEADVEMKRQALAQCDMPETKLMQYQPEDRLLAMLESL